MSEDTDTRIEAQELQFRRPKRGRKVHAIPAGDLHDGDHYARAICGYRPTGENQNCFGWMLDRSGPPCLLCEGVLVGRNDLDGASGLTGRLYDSEEPVWSGLTGFALRKAAAEVISAGLTKWHRASFQGRADIDLNPSAWEHKGGVWRTLAVFKHDDGGGETTSIVDVEAAGRLEDIVEYGMLPAMTFAPDGGFRVVDFRPSGAPRKRDPRLSR